MQGKTKGGTQTERHPVIRYPRLNVGKSRRAGAKRRKKTVLTPPLGGAGLICVNPRLKNSVHFLCGKGPINFVFFY